jgi:hypothetical protein
MRWREFIAGFGVAAACEAQVQRIDRGRRIGYLSASSNRTNTG